MSLLHKCVVFCCVMLVSQGFECGTELALKNPDVDCNTPCTNTEGSRDCRIYFREPKILKIDCKTKKKKAGKSMHYNTCKAFNIKTIGKISLCGVKETEGTHHECVTGCTKTSSDRNCAKYGRPQDPDPSKQKIDCKDYTTTADKKLISPKSRRSYHYNICAKDISGYDKKIANHDCEAKPPPTGGCHITRAGSDIEGQAKKEDGSPKEWPTCAKFNRKTYLPHTKFVDGSVHKFPVDYTRQMGGDKPGLFNFVRVCGEPGSDKTKAKTQYMNYIDWNEEDQYQSYDNQRLQPFEEKNRNSAPIISYSNSYLYLVLFAGFVVLMICIVCLAGFSGISCGVFGFYVYHKTSKQMNDIEL